MVFRPDGPPVPVVWFFTDPAAKPLGVSTPFASRNWEEKPDRFDPLGEQEGPRPWVPGLRNHALDGQRICRPITYLMFGLAEGQTLNRRVTFDGVPLCCLTPFENPPRSGSGPGVVSWVAHGRGAVPFKGSSTWLRDTRGVTPYALVFGGAATWTPGVIVPALYKKTILTNPTPNATFSGIFTSQIWTRRIQSTCVGPGGGGGGAQGGSSTSAGAGGGSCGATHLQFDLGVFPSVAYPFQIGGYGAGGAAGNNAGQDGTADTVFSGPTVNTAAHGLGGRGSPAVPFITGGIFNLGGGKPTAGNPGHPGVVMPGPSGNTPLGGAGACSTIGGAGDYLGTPGPGSNATPDTGSGGGGAVAASADQPGGNGSAGIIVVEEWNF